jgi:hypothetical protein
MAYLGGIHLVDGNDELTHSKGERQKGVLTGLAVLGNTGFELTSTTGNNKNSTIGLRCTSNHVFDKITVAGRINDLY